MKNPKTTLLGYLTSATGVLAALADAVPGKYALYVLMAGQVLTGISSVLAKDGGH
jgi:hypothetical protein